MLNLLSCIDEKMQERNEVVYCAIDVLRKAQGRALSHRDLELLHKRFSLLYNYATDLENEINEKVKIANNYYLNNLKEIIKKHGPNSATFGKEIASLSKIANGQLSKIMSHEIALYKEIRDSLIHS